MSIRSLWIIFVEKQSPATNTRGGNSTSGRLLYSRFYPLVEKKVKQNENENYVAIPKVPEFMNALLFELGFQDSAEKFIPGRDTCSKIDQKPVYEMVTSHGTLWPIVVVEQRNLLYCCIPMVTQGSHLKPPLIEIPGVTLSFGLLCGLADMLRQASTQEILQKSHMLNVYLNIAAPFGNPIDVNHETVLAKFHDKPCVLSKNQKQPAWKPVLHKGKNMVYISVTEYIRAVQYNKESVADCFDLYGTITCKAELEGAQTDVTLNISHVPECSYLPLDHLIIHPCVQSADAAIMNSDDVSRRPLPRRIRFIPPSEIFILCHYTVAGVKNLPIMGAYEMRMEGKTAHISLKLKLSDSVKNSFEYCEVQLPFYNRGQIVNQDSNNTQGNVMISPDRKILVWNIGPKFSSKSLSASLDATVNFNDAKNLPGEDQFCVGPNCYAKILFKIPDYTQSGCYVDPKTVQVSPNAKFKLTTVQEYLTGTEYKIWNSLGDSLVSAIPYTMLERVSIPE